MLQHLSRQQLLDQLVRSVEQCEHERRAREGVEKVTRLRKYIKVVTQKGKIDRSKS
jgi:hypothetical protein